MKWHQEAVPVIPSKLPPAHGAQTAASAAASQQHPEGFYNEMMNINGTFLLMWKMPLTQRPQQAGVQLRALCRGGLPSYKGPLAASDAGIAAVLSAVELSW